jgi:prevent-host-death family protein
MDVTVTDLRAHSEWLERARGGGEVVITDRGVPVARLLGLTTTATLERLAADGVIGRPAAAGGPGHPGVPARALAGPWPRSSVNSGAEGAARLL